MARKAGRLLGDIRALEEQHTLPQSNPIGLSQVRGGSATPSMGLSQFRGGGEMGRVVGGGTKKGQMRKTARRAYEGGRENEVEEAHRMGRALNLHLHNNHGGGYAKAFSHGCSGGAWYDFLDPNKNGVANAFQKVGNEFTNSDSVLRKTVLPKASQYAAYAAPVLDVAGTAVGLPGAGTMLSRGLSVAQKANEGAKAMGFGRMRGAGRESDDVRWLGGGRNSESSSESSSDSDDEKMSGGQSFANPSSMAMSGAYQGQGRKKRASAGPNDGRRKRAEVVKKVMAEKGLKMIEASKYVKEHGLY